MPLFRSTETSPSDTCPVHREKNIKAVNTFKVVVADGVPTLRVGRLILPEDLQADSDISQCMISPKNACTYILELARGILDNPLSKTPGQTPLTAGIGIGIGR